MLRSTFCLLSALTILASVPLYGLARIDMTLTALVFAVLAVAAKGGDRE